MLHSVNVYHRMPVCAYHMYVCMDEVHMPSQCDHVFALLSSQRESI